MKSANLDVYPCCEIIQPTKTARLSFNKDSDINLYLGQIIKGNFTIVINIDRVSQYFEPPIMVILFYFNVLFLLVLGNKYLKQLR